MPKPDNKPLFSGTLTETPFPKLFFEICSMGIGGTLTVMRGKVKKEITFYHGKPARITSNLLQEVLGRYLVSIGKIGEDDYQQTLTSAFTSHRLHGDILIERGFLTNGELSNYLREQSLAKLLNIFKWPDGDYSFVKRDFISPIKSDFQSLSTETIIFMGIKHHYALDRLIPAVDPYGSSYLYRGSKKSPLPETTPLDDDERWLLGLVDGTKTVKETIEISPLEFIDSYRVIYWALITDILAVKDKPAVAAVETDNPIPQDELLSKMVATYHAMSTMNYFEILGVDQSTPPEQIKPAYVRLAKEYHPDSLGPNAPTLVEKTANQIFDLVSRAYRVLSDEGERKDYLKSLSGKDDKVTIEKTHDIMNAELQFQKGKVFLKKRDYQSAKESFGWAVKLMPDEAEYLAYLGWALFLSAENKVGEEALTATKYLKKAASLNPSIETIQLFLGTVYKTQNLKDIAALYFKKALEINPESVEAKRELASLGVKSQQQDTRGFFGPRNR